MKPVVIFRHAKTEGAGFLGEFLDASAIPWEIVKVDRAEAVPHSASPYSGLVFMGGPMSVNDDLPWISHSLRLIRDAMDRDIPVLGHCLGGQLMAKALGGTVGRNEFREIGWGRVDVVEADCPWFGGLDSFEVFHWHGETFSIPSGAKRLLSSRWCENQAFAVGPHLGLQCHVEMTSEMVEAWCLHGAAEIEAHLSESVQGAESIREGLGERVVNLNRIAATIYGAWIKNLA